MNDIIKLCSAFESSYKKQMSETEQLILLIACNNFKLKSRVLSNNLENYNNECDEIYRDTCTIENYLNNVKELLNTNEDYITKIALTIARNYEITSNDSSLKGGE